MVILDGMFNHTQPYDYDEDYEYKDEDAGKAVWIPILFSVLVIVGLLGNGLLLAVLAQKRRSWRVSDSFILQLGVVDILLLVTLPFFAAHAPQSCGFCSQTLLMVFGAFFKINLYVGAFLLVCICLDHYLSSTHAGRCGSHRATLATLASLLVWLVSITLTVLDGIFLVNTESMPGKTLSVHSRPKTNVDWQLISRALHLGVGFLLPAFVQIMFCSHTIIRRSSRQSRIRPVLLILSLVGAFLLCWIPYNVTLVIDIICYTMGDFLRNVFVNRTTTLKTAVKVTSTVSCISACLRPPLYFLFCGNFRKAVFSVTKCAKVEGSLWELDVEAPRDKRRKQEEMPMSADQQVKQVMINKNSPE